MFFHEYDRAPIITDVHFKRRGTGKDFHDGRTRSHLAYVCQGEEIYHYGGGTVTAHAGDLVYIEHYTPYTIEHTNSVSIRLQIRTARQENGNRIEIVTTRTPEIFESLFRRIRLEWKGAAIGYPYRAARLFAEVYERLLVDETLLSHGKKYDVIRAGAEYLSADFRLPEASVAEAARRSAVSEVYFRKIYREVFGKTPKEALTAFRIGEAQELLTLGTLRVGEVAAACGFASVKHFSRAFREATGLSPRAWAKSGERSSVSE